MFPRFPIRLVSIMPTSGMATLAKKIGKDNFAIYINEYFFIYFKITLDRYYKYSTKTLSKGADKRRNYY